jgi:hypothetical protein
MAAKKTTTKKSTTKKTVTKKNKRGVQCNILLLKKRKMYQNKN